MGAGGVPVAAVNGTAVAPLVTVLQSGAAAVNEAALAHVALPPPPPAPPPPAPPPPVPVGDPPLDDVQAAAMTATSSQGAAMSTRGRAMARSLREIAWREGPGVRALDRNRTE